MNRRLSVAAMSVTLVTLPVVLGLTARAAEAPFTPPERVVWFEEVRREALESLQALLSPDLHSDADHSPIFQAPEPVPSDVGDLGFAWPVRDATQVTSRYGIRNNPFQRERVQFHHGLDIRCSTGEPVRASNAGRVVGIASSEIYGTNVTLAHDYGFTSFYAHLSSVAVRGGERVSRGTTIGACGATGLATGPHLHFEIRHGAGRYDPQSFLP